MFFWVSGVGRFFLFCFVLFCLLLLLLLLVFVLFFGGGGGGGAGVCGCRFYQCKGRVLSQVKPIQS